MKLGFIGKALIVIALLVAVASLAQAITMFN